MASEASPAGRTLFGHPPGMTVLFMTQMWAEFSYFGLQALLVYYMTPAAGVQPGQVLADLRRVRRGGVLQPVHRRDHRRSLARAEAQRRDRRIAHDVRPFRHGVRGTVVSRTGAGRDGQRPVPAAARGAGGGALRRPGSAPDPGIQRLLYGDQPGRPARASGVRHAGRGLWLALGLCARPGSAC